MGIRFQTDLDKSIRYGSNTAYNSACGPSALCNALSALGIAEVTIPTMCKFSEAHGARVEGGTAMRTLLDAAAPVYRFEYRTTNKNAELLEHLRSGGVAIMNQGSAYKVFSNGGHFVLARSVDQYDVVTVWDSYWTSTKYISWPTYHANRTGTKGIVRATISKIGKATADRSPCYYLISKQEDDMTEREVRDIIAKVKAEEAQRSVSAWANGYFAACKDAGILDGTAPAAPVTREQLARVMVASGVVTTAENPSGWAVALWNAAIAAGITDGSRPRAFITRQEAAAMIMRATKDK